MFVTMDPVDLDRTFALQNLGRFDPTATLTRDRFTKSFIAATGICTVVIETTPGGLLVTCQGSDADTTRQEMASFLMASVGQTAFSPQHLLIERLHRDQPGLRIIRVPWLFDIACSAILQQRVRATDAMTDWRHIAEKYGDRGTDGTVAFPSAAMLAALASWQLEALGIDPKRSRTLIALARELRMYPLRGTATYQQLRGRLGRIAGVGPWTVEMILGFGAGDPDALPLGDLHLPHLVAYALAGEPRGTDERMLELLEPFRGHRFRVTRLLYGAHLDVPRTSSLRR